MSSFRFPALAPVLFGILLWSAACSDSTGPKAALAPLVGTWRAEALVLTNKANASQVVDLVEEGAVFTISILGNGQYSATLSAFGQGGGDFGKINVKGNQITLESSVNPPTTGTWSIQGGNLLVDGDTEFDFNQDGTPEEATIHMELYRIDL